MTIESLGDLAASEVVKQTIKKGVEAVFGSLARKHKLSMFDQYKHKYIDYCFKTLHIKTLILPDQSIFIDDIFVPIGITPSGVSSGPNNVTLNVNESTTLDHEKAIVIKGLAGQGKSTILRKLLSNNARSYSRLPIFYELKNYKGGSIEDSIYQLFHQYGINIDADEIRRLLDDSNVKLYLDAFDETPPEYRDQLLDEIRRLFNRYQCHVVCTTRPDTELESLIEPVTYNVCLLTEPQVFEIIHKTSSDYDKASELCSALKKTPLHKGSDSILKSPILVILYCASYNLGEEIPDTLSQFYSNIFDTVFFRHDNLKGKVSRIRHWNDNKRIYRDLFNCLCFISQRVNKVSFSKDLLTQFLSDSLEYIDEDSGLADKLLIELSTITNLIIEDGFNEHKFVHKSIQEFFSASFVCSLLHEKKIGFYKRCSEDFAFHTTFRNTLFFLQEIDYYNYIEHYLIPSINELLSLGKRKITNDTEVDERLVKLFLSNVTVRARILIIRSKTSKNKGREVSVSKPEFSSPSEYPEVYSRLFAFAITQVPLIDDTDTLGALIETYGSHLGDDRFEISLDMLLHQMHNKLETDRKTYKRLSDKFLQDVKNEQELVAKYNKGNNTRRVPKKITKPSGMKAVPNVPKKNISEVLNIAAHVLFRREYNEALEKLGKRNSSLKNAGYFDF